VSSASSIARQAISKGNLPRGGSDAADLLIARDLIEQFWQHRRISNVAASDLNSSYLQRLLVDPEMNLAPDTPFCATRRPAGQCPERDACVHSTHLPPQP